MYLAGIINQDGAGRRRAGGAQPAHRADKRTFNYVIRQPARMATSR